MTKLESAVVSVDLIGCILAAVCGDGHVKGVRDGRF